MKRLILILLFLPLLVSAQLVEIDLPAPGYLGMVSNVGANDSPIDAMRYSLNMDVFTTPGVLRQRRGLKNYGGTNLYLYGATGYYNPYDFNRLVVGVHDSTFVWFDTGGIPHSSLVGHFFVSDTFAVNPTTGAFGLVFPYRSVYHDWLSWRDMLFHCDGKSTPSIITTSQTFLFRDSTDSVNNQISTFDTLGFQPRAISLGLEAPGQLRVGLTDIFSLLNGNYRYSYAYVNTGGDSTSKMAIPSAIVSTKNEAPYLTQFEEHAATTDSVHKLILRQRQDGSAQWFVIDTMQLSTFDSTVTVIRMDLHSVDNGNIYHQDGHPDGYVYKIIITTDNGTIDSAYVVTVGTSDWIYFVAERMTDSLNAMSVLGDSVIVNHDGLNSITVRTVPPLQGFSYTNDTGMTVTTILDSVLYSNTTANPIYIDTLSDSAAVTKWDPSKIDSTIRTPGGLTAGATQSGSDNATVADSAHAYIDSLYNVAYSYYDPTTGLESPLGPSLHIHLTDSVVAATPDSIIYTALTTGWPATGRPQWIRWYQGIVQSTLGGFDSTIWYGLFQQRTNDSARTAILGNWTDLSVVVGLDTNTITTDTLYTYQLFVDVNGDPIQRPPYSYDLQIPFTQMRQAHNRIYGISPNPCPTCLWYTPVDTVSWNPVDFFEIPLPGGDEFVAIEELNGTLWILAHNSIWFLPGFNAEIETPYGRIVDNDAIIWQQTDQYGAVSRSTVVKYKDAIYFLTADRKVAIIDAGGIRTISDPIRDFIDTLFSEGAVDPTFFILDRRASLFAADDQLKLVNDSTGKLLSYHIPTQTWGVQKYTSHIPTRSFAYDSTEGLVGIGEAENYFAVGTGNFKQEYLAETEGAAVGDESGEFDWAAEFRIGGDGFNHWSVNQINLMLLTNSYMQFHHTIYNWRNVSSTTDSFTVPSLADYSPNFIRWDVNHDPLLFPLVRIWGETGEDSTITPPQPLPVEVYIESIKFLIEKKGLIHSQ